MQIRENAAFYCLAASFCAFFAPLGASESVGNAQIKQMVGVKGCARTTQMRCWRGEAHDAHTNHDRRGALGADVGVRRAFHRR